MLLDLFRQRYGRTPIGLDRDTAARGEQVAAAGRVLSVTETEPGQLTGEVEGSAAEVYRTEVRMTAHGAVIQVISRCSCPVGAGCKHGAALLLTWLRDQQEMKVAPPVGNAAEAPATSVPSAAPVPGYERLQVLHWVRGLRTLKLPTTAGGARTSLCYVLRNEHRRAALYVYRIRRGPDDQMMAPEPYRGLATQAADPPSYWDEADVMAAAMLQRSTPVPGGFMLDSPRARDVLMHLARSGRLYRDAPPSLAAAPVQGALNPSSLPGSSAPLRVGPTRTASLQWRQPVDAAQAAPGSPLRLGLQVEADAEPIYTAQPCWLDRAQGVIGPVEVSLPPELIAWLRAAPAVPADAAEDVALALHAQLLARPDLKQVVPSLSAHPVRERPGQPRPVIGLFPAASVAPGKAGQRAASGPRDRMALSFAVQYEGRQLEPLRSVSLGIRDQQGPVLVLCDHAAERACLSHLSAELQQLARDEPALKLSADPPGEPSSGRPRSGSGWMTVALLPAASVSAARIRFDLLPRLQAQGWAVVDESVGAPRLVEADSVQSQLSEVDADTQTGGAGGTHWFELQSGIQVAGNRVDLAPVLADLIAMGGFDAWRQARCPDGWLWMPIAADQVLRIEAHRIEPLARVVSDWSQVQRDAQGDAVRLRIDALAAASLAAGDASISVPASLEGFRQACASFEGLTSVAVPDRFLATLRPYQQQGLAWLQFIASTGTGGVLADDMGLGKTVQVLAHLACEQASGRMQSPVLVVAPTSLVFNWQDEARRHAPTLRVLALHGSTRSQHFDRVDEHDLVITTYALLPRDLDVLGARRWHAVIADEAHQIKNARTRAAAAIRSLQSHHRIALTGTPLENHLGELWSIMQFVVPGLLGREDAFRARFRLPIERPTSTAQGDEARERMASLQRRIKPFLLRRTKAAVLGELPPRTDILRRVDLGPEQRDLYESVRSAMDERVRQALADAGVEGSRIVVLDALLKLRQACCDPSLLALPAARRVKSSAKLDALLELLLQLTQEGRKVLVFSQFTRMLDRIEQALDADEQLGSVLRSRLDGDTADRRGAVEAFQLGDARIFLLSLKAGGVGLNLTAADTVIHYDPWWNPAVEAQATDRAHRLGQQRAVFVYKLIAAGTIEERILDLQTRKGELSQAVLDGAMSGDGLSRDDLLGLFELTA